MLSYKSIKENEPQFQSLTGMSVSAFESLHTAYKKQWEKYMEKYTVSGEKRVRPHRKRKDGVLEETQDQLLFILDYLKNNSLQERHAASYGMRQSQCNVWLHLLLELLQQTLKTSGHLPQRDPAKLKQALAVVKEVFIDGTERSIERPQDKEAQSSHYSGKKKRIK